MTNTGLGVDILVNNLYYH